MVSDFFSRVKKKFGSFCSVNKFLKIPPNFPQMPFIYPKIPLHFLSRKKSVRNVQSISLQKSRKRCLCASSGVRHEETIFPLRCMFNQFDGKNAERDAYVRPVGSDVLKKTISLLH